MAFDLRDKLRMKQKKISFVVFHNNNNTTAIMSPGITISTDRDDHVGEVDHADGVLPLESHGETEAGAEAGDQMSMASGLAAGCRHCCCHTRGSKLHVTAHLLKRWLI